MTTLDPGYLQHLYNIVESRKGVDASESYIASLYSKGSHKIAQKVGEEAVETVIEAIAKDKNGIINESADLIFHWLILLADQGITLDEVFTEMHRREGVSGLTEKANRKG